MPDAPRQKTALIMAGGTGGHIFPALAVAQTLRTQGWDVTWLGSARGMEARIAPENGFALHAVDFSGVRGKGAAAWLRLPLRLLRALWQARAVLRRVRPAVVLGFGGYITVPGALAAWLARTPLLLHEQNAVAGSANRLLARGARQVFTAFADTLPGAQWVGNPLRPEFLRQEAPEQRFAGRSGPLRLLVLGGSLGAQILNAAVPQALARLQKQSPPLAVQVLHQSGAAHIETLRQRYAGLPVQAECTPFLADVAGALAHADLIVCRAGASTVCEIAAVGAAAIYVPFAAAVDDHQSANARRITAAGGGWLLAQKDCTPEQLARMIAATNRATLREKAQTARRLHQPGAAEAIASACQRVLDRKK